MAAAQDWLCVQDCEGGVARDSCVWPLGAGLAGLVPQIRAVGSQAERSAGSDAGSNEGGARVGRPFGAAMPWGCSSKGMVLYRSGWFLRSMKS